MGAWCPLGDPPPDAHVDWLHISQIIIIVN